MPLKPSSESSRPAEPVILPRAAHGLSRSRIDPNTLQVLYRLRRAGHLAYLVGGGVRDLLLGRTPKDFDVGTDATPQQVKKLFRNCFLVGRRFRLAHVRFGADEVVEVATFRRQATADDLPEDPSDHRLLAENVFGTPREDAFRRDFTINALFYDIATFSIIDHVGGLADLEARRLRVIGDPLVRFTEDPVRMLRALEFAARLDFTLDEATREGIYTRAPLIAEAAPARIREELLELFRHAVAGKVLRQAQATGLLEPLLAGFEGDDATFALLDRIDARTRGGAPPGEGLVLAALFLSRFLRQCPPTADLPIGQVLELANLELDLHCGYFRISHGTRHQARELLVGCYRLGRGRGHRGERRFLQHPATPLALELFDLWHQTPDGHRQLVETWRSTLHQPAKPGVPQAPAEAPAAPQKRRRRGRRRRPRGAARPDA
ncbi:MAG: polynucleotide adenylyltransferase PcnB [Deltaproteobacteria bacterium]|nr:MAG: polynucleotide adenylyltransferase PcnB [Deltaproteobacteria bacterium]